MQCKKGPVAKAVLRCINGLPLMPLMLLLIATRGKQMSFGRYNSPALKFSESKLCAHQGMGFCVPHYSINVETCAIQS